MTLKTSRARLRLTEIESLTDAGRSDAIGIGVEAANEIGARDGGAVARPVSDQPAVSSTARPPAKEGDAMPYRDSAAGLTIGEELTQARQIAGLELDDVAAHLRIRREFLAALEDGRPDALPGLTYAIGYVRTYAAFLGLDVEQAVTRFKQEAAGLAKRTQLVFPSPAPEGRVPGLGLVLASVVLAGFAYGGWYWMSERGLSVYDMVPEVPERLATLIEGQSAAPISPTPPAPVQPAAPSGGSDAATESAYRAANPTSVPVTARSDSGDAPAAGSVERAPVAAAPVPVDSSPVVSEPVVSGPATTDTTSSDTASSDAAAADPATMAAAASDTPTFRQAVPVPAAPSSEGTAAVTTTDAAAGPAAGPSPEAPSTAVPSDAARSVTRPADAETTAPPPRSAVPSAPRLSGLIGATEAAVPNSAQNTPVPAANERVLVRATGESWVQVRSGDGTTLFTRVLRSGDVYRVPDRSGLTLATGNAGALEILVDGQPVPSLGSFGEVVRNIALDPDRLAAGTAIAGRN